MKIFNHVVNDFTTTYLRDILDIEKLEEHVTNGVIRCQDHPLYPRLTILNYTEKAQFDRIWDSVTSVCRGLIVETSLQVGPVPSNPFDGARVIARAFNKFHNLNTEYVPETMEENLIGIPEVTDKLDGCFLGNTLLNLWDGGTITIREVVKNRLKVKLVGADVAGRLVPTEIVDWFDNGIKDQWLLLTVDCLPSLKSGCRTGNHIPVTPNHRILLNGRYQPAAYAKVGDLVSTQELRPDNAVLELIRAGLLGDGSLSKNGTHSYSYGENHKQEHLEYVKEIRLWLGECAIQGKSKVSGHGTIMEQANSKAYTWLERIRQLWYPNGTKVVPKDLSWMNNFCVAKWYMDDGSLQHDERQKDRAHFATNGFKKKDCERLGVKLRELYGVDYRLSEDNRGGSTWSVRLNAGKNGEIDKFWKAIAAHIVPCLRYKLPKEYRNVKYSGHTPGKEIREKRDVKILRISKLTGDQKTATHSYFRSGCKGFDIKTTTGNYMVRGVLVHNSLGIVFPYDNQWHVATRGSFDSDQARWATAFLREHLNVTELLHPDEPFPKGYTPVCEIIYAANRIVVSYDFEGLVLLAFVGPNDAYEMPRAMAERAAVLVGLPIVKKFKKTLSECVKENIPNTEGYVLTYPNGVKVKVKFEEYVRLHRILTGLSPIAVWEMMKNSQDSEIDRLLEDPKIPEGFKTWLKKWDAKLSEDFSKIEDTTYKLHTLVKEAGLIREKYSREERKALAEFIIRTVEDITYQKGLQFALADGKSIIQEIWEYIRPNGKAIDTFKKEGE